MAHDETNECHVGDRVRIVEHRPLSRCKRWRVQSKLSASTVPPKAALDDGSGA
jgi:ribosomal protein S17